MLVLAVTPPLSYYAGLKANELPPPAYENTWRPLITYLICKDVVDTCNEFVDTSYQYKIPPIEYTDVDDFVLKVYYPKCDKTGGCRYTPEEMSNAYMDQDHEFIHPCLDTIVKRLVDCKDKQSLKAN